jgi:hypothetical protein
MKASHHKSKEMTKETESLAAEFEVTQEQAMSQNEQLGQRLKECEHELQR